MTGHVQLGHTLCEEDDEMDYHGSRVERGFGLAGMTGPIITYTS